MSLKDIERKLLYKQVLSLNTALQPGHESLNLSSLGIPSYIKECKTAINQFRDTKKIVAKHSQMIEDFVKSIEESSIQKEFDFEARKEQKEQNQLCTVMEFHSYFEEHRKTIV